MSRALRPGSGFHSDIIITASIGMTLAVAEALKDKKIQTKISVSFG